MKGKSVATRRAVPNCADYVLTSYAAWWHRMETETSNFFKDVRKEEKKRKLKQQERELLRSSSLVAKILLEEQPDC